MKTSPEGMLALLCREAVVLSAYKDSVGVWTIGVGHTAAAGEPIPEPGLRITLEEAVALFGRDLKRYEEDVEKAVKVPLEQHEFDALVSFHYNTGGIFRAKLTKALNAGDRAGAAKGFMGWLQPPEIRGRRESEQRQFMTGDVGDISHVLVYDRYPGKARKVPTYSFLLPAKPKGIGELQTALVAVTGLPVAVTGVEDGMTLAALLLFQFQHGLTVDGIAGPKTWATLDREIARLAA